MNAAEPLPEQLLGELRLRRTRKKKYYLINLKVGEEKARVLHKKNSYFSTLRFGLF